MSAETLGVHGGLPMFQTVIGGVLQASAVSASLSPSTVDTGALFNNVLAGYTVFTFQLVGPLSGFSVTLYGTIDKATAQGTASNWFPIDAPAQQSGTGTVANPLTSTAQSLQYRGILRAVRAVSIASAATGTMNCLLDGAP